MAIAIFRDGCPRLPNHQWWVRALNPYCHCHGNILAEESSRKLQVLQTLWWLKSLMKEAHVAMLSLASK
jgi:hypothetical protein